MESSLREFSHNYNMENMENLESVKSMAETNFQMCFMINTKGLYDMEFLQIHCRSLQLVCKLKNQHNDFHTFHKLNYGKTRMVTFLYLSHRSII